MDQLILLLFFFVILLCFSTFWAFRKNKRLANKVPGLYELSLVHRYFLNLLGWETNSCVPALARIQDALMGMAKLTSEEGIYSLELLTMKLVFLNSPKTVETIANSLTEIYKGSAYDSARMYMKDGLIPSNGDEKWRRHRRMIKPSFFNRIINEVYLPVFNKHSEKLVKILSNSDKKECLDLSATIDSTTFGIILESALGTKLKEHEIFYKKIHDLLFQLKAVWMKRNYGPFINMLWFFKLTPHGRRFLKQCQEYSEFMEMVIRKKREELVKLKEKSGLPYIDPDEDINRKAFLDFMIVQQMNEKDSFTDMEIIEEVSTFITAGYDTLSMAMTWAIYLIGLHPDIQKKVQDELDEIFGDNREREVTIADIGQMKYIEGCIKEALRLFPAVPLISRQLKNECLIGDQLLPKGTQVYLHYWAIHRHPDYYSNPDIFDPTRNFPEKAYMPFSAGPRSCIGQKFAGLEEKVIIANIFRNFHVTSLEPLDKVHYVAEIVGRPLTNLKVKITIRD